MIQVRDTARKFSEIWKPVDGTDAGFASWKRVLHQEQLLRSTGTEIVNPSIGVYSNGNQILVRATLAGPGIVEPSGIAAVVDPKTRQITQTVETTFVQGSGGGTVSTWIDGLRTLERFVPNPEDSISTVATIGWNEFVSCLNGAGVAAWVVTALSIACGAICAGTGGAGCVPCLAAAGGLTGGVFYSCAGRAIFYS